MRSLRRWLSSQAQRQSFQVFLPERLDLHLRRPRAASGGVLALAEMRGTSARAERAVARAVGSLGRGRRRLDGDAPPPHARESSSSSGGGGSGSLEREGVVLSSMVSLLNAHVHSNSLRASSNSFEFAFDSAEAAEAEWGAGRESAAAAAAAAARDELAAAHVGRWGSRAPLLAAAERDVAPLDASLDAALDFAEAAEEQEARVAEYFPDAYHAFSPRGAVQPMLAASEVAEGGAEAAEAEAPAGLEAMEAAVEAAEAVEAAAEAAAEAAKAAEAAEAEWSMWGWVDKEWGEAAPRVAARELDRPVLRDVHGTEVSHLYAKLVGAREAAGCDRWCDVPLPPGLSERERLQWAQEVAELGAVDVAADDYRVRWLGEASGEPGERGLRDLSPQELLGRARVQRGIQAHGWHPHLAAAIGADLRAAGALPEAAGAAQPRAALGAAQLRADGISKRLLLRLLTEASPTPRAVALSALSPEAGSLAASLLALPPDATPAAVRVAVRGAGRRPAEAKAQLAAFDAAMERSVARKADVLAAVAVQSVLLQTLQTDDALGVPLARLAQQLGSVVRLHFWREALCEREGLRAAAAKERLAAFDETARNVALLEPWHAGGGGDAAEAERLRSEAALAAHPLACLRDVPADASTTCPVGGACLAPAGLLAGHVGARDGLCGVAAAAERDPRGGGGEASGVRVGVRAGRGVGHGRQVPAGRVPRCALGAARALRAGAAGRGGRLGGPGRRATAARGGGAGGGGGGGGGGGASGVGGGGGGAAADRRGDARRVRRAARRPARGGRGGVRPRKGVCAPRREGARGRGQGAGLHPHARGAPSAAARRSVRGAAAGAARAVPDGAPSPSQRVAGSERRLFHGVVCVNR